MEKRLTREEIAQRLDPEKIKKHTVSFDTVLTEELKDPEFKEAYERECLRYEIAKKIRETRKGKKLTQVELAKRAHTTQKVISHIEHGEVSIGVNVLQKITDALGLKIMIS